MSVFRRHVFYNALGTQAKEEYKRNCSYLIENGAEKFTLSFIDTGERTWHNIESMNKAALVEEIQKEIDKGKIENTNVVSDESGIKIQVENILFLPDSTELIPGENNRIAKIAEIVSNYKDRGILIVGHTALAGSKAERQLLSVKRAQVIADYLIKLNAIDPLKTSIVGKGAEEPIADNSAEEGKKRNRRVEIHILEE